MPSPVEVSTTGDQSANAEASASTLAAFVKRNGRELVALCAGKVLQRNPAMPLSAVASTGVARFLRQLVDVLELEHGEAGRIEPAPLPAHISAEIGETAAMHGNALMHQGYTVDQVVHAYGDVCQSVTELAISQDTPFSTDEFRILNRCLDDAIAGAVVAYHSVARQSGIDARAGKHRRLQVLVDDHQRLVGIARHSLAAIRSGHVGNAGATGILLAHTLDELASLGTERMQPLVDQFR